MRQKNLSQAVLFENGPEHLVLNLWIRLVILNQPLFATRCIANVRDVVANFAPQFHPFFSGEMAQEADGCCQDYAVAL